MISQATLAGTTSTVAVSVALTVCDVSKELAPVAVTVFTKWSQCSTGPVMHGAVDWPGCRVTPTNAALHALRFKLGSDNLIFVNGVVLGVPSGFVAGFVTVIR